MQIRDSHQDLLKAFAIILVVYGHMARGVIDAGNASADVLAQIDFVIYTTHMPVFFLMAGYNGVQSLLRRGTANYLKLRWAALIYPYLLWSSILWATKAAATVVARLNHPVALSDLLSIAWQPISPYWFLYALLLMQLLLLVFWSRAKLYLILTLAGMACWEFFHPEMALTVLEPTVLHLPFFAFGAWLAAEKRPLFPLFVKTAAGLIVAFVVLIGAVPLASTFPSLTPVGILTLPISLAGIGLLMALAHHVPSGAVQRYLIYLGRLSFPIYLMHILFTAQIRIVLSKLGFTDAMALLVLGTLFGVLMPVAIYEISMRLGIANWLGLTTGPQRRPASGGSASPSTSK